MKGRNGGSYLSGDILKDFPRELNVVLQRHYKLGLQDFHKLLITNGVKEKAWNADELGVPLCSASRKVIGLQNSKNMYSITREWIGLHASVLLMQLDK